MATKWSQKANPSWFGGSRFAPISNVLPAVQALAVPAMVRGFEPESQIEDAPESILGTNLESRESKIIGKELRTLGAELGLGSLATTAALAYGAPKALNIGNVLGLTASSMNLPAKVASSMAKTGWGLLGFDPGSVKYGNFATQALPGLLGMINPTAGILAGFVAPVAVDVMGDALDLRDNENQRDFREDAFGAIAARQLQGELANAKINALNNLRTASVFNDRTVSGALDAHQNLSSNIDSWGQMAENFGVEAALADQATRVNLGFVSPKEVEAANAVLAKIGIMPKELQKEINQSGIGVATPTRERTSYDVLGETMGLTGVHSLPGTLARDAYNNAGHAVGVVSGYAPGMSPGEDSTFGGMGMSSSSSSGSSTSSGKVICTELCKRGLLNKSTHENESAWCLKTKSSTTLRGYHYWAVPFVNKYMKDESTFLFKIIKYLAVRFAEYAAWNEPGIGWMVDKIGTPICWLIGKIIKYDKFDKKYDRKDSERLVEGEK